MGDDEEEGRDRTEEEEEQRCDRNENEDEANKTTDTNEDETTDESESEERDPLEIDNNNGKNRMLDINLFLPIEIIKCCYKNFIHITSLVYFLINCYHSRLYKCAKLS